MPYTSPHASTTAYEPSSAPSSALSDTTTELLRHPDLWRAGQLAPSQERPVISTGYAELDQQLPGGGWPAAGLMELLMPSAGIGELRLLMPALRHLSQSENRWLTWINPPFIPYAPALQHLGIDSSKILLIHPRNHADTLWALERACKSGSCASVFAWLDEKKVSATDSRRLQVAARQGNTLTCLFRPQRSHSQNSMAELRLALSSNGPDRVGVEILKRRGGWPVHGLDINVAVPTALDKAHIQEQLDLWRAGQTVQNMPDDRPAEMPQPLHIPASAGRDALPVH